MISKKENVHYLSYSVFQCALRKLLPYSLVFDELKSVWIFNSCNFQAAEGFCRRNSVPLDSMYRRAEGTLRQMNTYFTVSGFVHVHSGVDLVYHIFNRRNFFCLNVENYLDLFLDVWNDICYWYSDPLVGLHWVCCCRYAICYPLRNLIITYQKDLSFSNFCLNHCFGLLFLCFLTNHVHCAIVGRSVVK